MALTLQQAIEQTRLNQQAGNPLSGLAQVLPTAIIQGFQQEQQRQQREELMKQQRLQQEAERQHEIDMKLAEIGAYEDENRQTTGEIQRVLGDKDGALHKRGVIGKPAMSLAEGGEGDVTGQPIKQDTDLSKIIGRRQPSKLQRLSDIQRQKIESEKAKEQAKLDEAEEKRTREADQQLFDRADKLRDEFRGSKVFKDFQEISRAANNIESAYENSLVAKDKLAADQALVVSFNKLLDPGSVVRESEFARTPQGQAAIRAAQGRIQQLFQGGVGLTQEGRAEIRNMASELLTQAQQGVQSEMEVFGNLADRFDVPRDMIFGGFGESFDIVGDAPQQSAQQYTEGQTATNPETGQTIIFRGGQWQQL